MKLLIGLGNPGTKYKNNRHNAGALCAQFLISNFKFLKNFQIQISNQFMNNSGVFVNKVTKSYDLSPSDLYVAHDDLDLKLGTYKIQFGVGPKVHNGIKSIEDALNTKDFWRVRIGIDNRKDAIGSPAGGLQHDTGADYVLSDFSKEELTILEKVYAEIRDDIAKI